MAHSPMVWVLSVHYESADWVQRQRIFLDRFIDRPNSRVFVAHGVDKTFFLPSETVLDYQGSHAASLDALAAFALGKAHPDDWLLFIDSDAFPVAKLSGLQDGTEKMVAVQRLENLGDPQPHPCFTLVKAHLWKELGPTWQPGFSWKNTIGKSVTDVGAGVLERLNATGTDWTKLRRVNRLNPHALWFGLYGPEGGTAAVYHHGAGSRARHSRVDDAAKRGASRWRKWFNHAIFLSSVVRLNRRGLSIELRDARAAGQGAVAHAILERLDRGDSPKPFMV